jgi:cytochrome b involved in lipid metabolism
MQVSSHATSGDCWSAVNGSVYNLSGWVSKHPGGSAVIIGMCGGDGSGSFNGRHSTSSKAKAALTPFLLGTYTGGPGPAPVAPSAAPAVSFTATVVATHNKSADCWVIINGYVYNLTVWKAKHSGGATNIDPVCGADGSARFSGQHSGSATTKLNVLAQYAQGSLSGSPLPATPIVTPTTPYTFTQVATHNKTTDCWVTVNGNVYDLTAWKGTHSGGVAIINAVCGKDGSATFASQHGTGTTQATFLASYMKGIVSGSAVAAPVGTYTIADVVLHSKSTDCWVALVGNVYNLTAWKSSHSGGVAIIDGVCGKDGTSTFYSKHSGAVSSKQGVLSAYLIGTQSGYVPVALPAAVTIAALGGAGEYTMADVALHSTSGDCWSAIGGAVYGLSTWIPVHPGGSGVVIAMCGADGTASYSGKHGGSGSAAAILGKIRIGSLVSVKKAAVGMFSTTDVATHKTATDCWSVVNGVVYDLTAWIGQHPGGSSVIKAMCGIDGTDMYLGKHGASASIQSSLDLMKVGTLVGGSAAATTATATTVAVAKSFSMKQVRKHSTATNCWTVINANVYNMTRWTRKHVHAATVKSMCGRNATTSYNRTHGGAVKASRTLRHYLIGHVAATVTVATPAATTFSLAQVSAHSTVADCWSVVSGGVYNLTTWIGEHPGGAGVIKAMCGKDATVSFQSMHSSSSSAKAALVKLMVGVVG